MSSSVAAHRVGAILRIGSVKGFGAFHPRLQDLRVVAQWITAEYHEIGIFALFQRSNPILQIEHLGAGQGQAFKGLLARHPGADG